MVGQRKRRIRTPRYPRRWPWVFLAGRAWQPAVGALLLLAYIRGHGAPKSGPPFFQDVLETMTNAGVALVLAFAALAIGCWSFRKIWMQWLAWHPGPIEVDTFASGSQLPCVDAAQLTMRFRQRLAKLRLRVPTPVPGTAAESDFLEVLGRNGLDSKNILGSVLNVVRAASRDTRGRSTACWWNGTSTPAMASRSRSSGFRTTPLRRTRSGVRVGTTQ